MASAPQQIANSAIRASPGASGTPSSSNGVANTGQTPEIGRISAVADDAIERFHSDPNRIQGSADTVSTPRPSVNTMAVFGYNSYLRDLRFRARFSPCHSFLSYFPAVPVHAYGRCRASRRR